MVERIRLLLETRQLTPTQFADAIGIARPIVSHILSGRNKPSLEVVQRILAAMPDLSMPWLLNGTGTMQAAAASAPPSPAAVVVPHPAAQIPEKEDSAAAVSPVPSSPVVAPLPRRGDNPYPAPKPNANSVKFPGPKRFASSSKTVSVPEPTAITPEPAIAPALQLPQQLGSVQVAPPSESQSQPLLATDAPAATPADDRASPIPSIATALFAGAQKPIRRIVIFYRDGSFGDYQPE